MEFNERKCGESEELEGVITRDEKRQSMLNIVALMGSASIIGLYAGYRTGVGADLNLALRVALTVPAVLSAAYFSVGEPRNTSDVERISESRVEIIELGDMTRSERVFSGIAGFGFAATSTAFAYGIGYVAGSIADRL